MGITRVKSIPIDKLVQDESGPTIVKLMMVSNDIRANDVLLHNIIEQQENKLDPKFIGTKLYLIRLAWSHLYEGLDIVEEIPKYSLLLSTLKRSHPTTQDSYEFVSRYTKGGADRRRMEDLVGKLRSNLTFHYSQSGKVIRKAVEFRRTNQNKPFGTIELGDTFDKWYYKIADELLDNIVVRQFWEIGNEEDTKNAAKERQELLQLILGRFLAFSNQFIWKYFQM